MISTKSSLPRRLLILLLGLTLVRGLIYALVVPPWQAPDEWGHFETSHLMARHGRLVLAEEDRVPALEREMIASAYESRFWWVLNRDPPPAMPTRLSDTPTLGVHRTAGVRHSLSYWWYAAVDRFALHQDVVTQLYLMRISSLLVALALVWVGWIIVGEISSLGSPFFLGVVALLVFHPQHTFMHAVVNDGNLPELFISLIYLLLLRCWARGWDWRRVLAIGVLLAAGLVAKKTAYAMLIYVPLVVVLYAWRQGRFRFSRNRRRALVWWGVVLAVVLLSLLTFWTLVDPDGHVARVRQMLAEPEANAGVWLYRTTVQAFTMWWSDPGSQLTNCLRPRLLYVPLILFTLGGVAGWVRIIVDRGDRNREWLGDPRLGRDSLAILGLAVIVVVAFTAAGTFPGYAMSGRYLFTAFIPTVIVLVAGWAEWIPLRHHALAARIMLFLLVLLDWWVIASHLVVRYYV